MKEGEDYYYSKEGLMVLTTKYLKKEVNVVKVGAVIALMVLKRVNKVCELETECDICSPF